MRRFFRVAATGLLLCAGLGSPVAWAGRVSGDQDEARAALESGAIRPLEQIIAAARERVEGDIVKVKLDREGSRWLYELRIVDRQGRLRDVVIDAATASLVRIEDD